MTWYVAPSAVALGRVLLAGSINAALVPDHLRARVQGAYTIVNYGVRPLGSLTAGLAATAFGIQTALWIATVGGALSGLWLVRSPLPHLRTLPQAPIEPVTGPVAG